MTRRTVIELAGAAAALPSLRAQSSPLKGRLKQSVARWCYGKMSLEDLAREGARMGLRGIDLIDYKEWPVAQKYGLVPAMTPGAGTISDAFNRRENHDRLVSEMEENINRAAAAKVPNVITFSGNRRGQADAEGLDNCTIGLNRVKKLAEDKGVTICVELLNSKIDHHDYQCDHTAWGVELIKRVDSPRVKLLYDIYHMQIMEGDIIRTIRQNIQYIAHFHTGGVPGRHELDDTQELQWRTIAQAIVDTGFTGYFAHEFVPTRDPMTSLEQAVKLCDV
ncbi:MAG TPA: TIM barrel protein [Bryobacteraceae bacterium]|nr:TIM barrel protein [Bryobacteraceae bacterium]